MNLNLFGGLQIITIILFFKAQIFPLANRSLKLVVEYFWQDTDGLWQLPHYLALLAVSFTSPTFPAPNLEIAIFPDSFNGKWYFKTIIWEQGMLTAIGLLIVSSSF